MTDIHGNDVDDTDIPVLTKRRKAPASAFKKGDPRINRKGQPVKRDSLAKQLREAGEGRIKVEKAAGVFEIMTRAERLREIVWDMALVNRDRNMIKLIYDRLDGTPAIVKEDRETVDRHDVEFAKFRIRSSLFDEQLALLATRKKMAMMLCGRRSGKTVSIAAKMTDLAITHDKGTILYVTKTVGQAYKNVWQFLIDFVQVTGMVYKANSAEYTIHLDCGTKIVLSGSDTIDQIDKLRGQPYLAAFIDEIQSIKYARLLVDEIIRPATKDFIDPLIVLSGTAPRAANTAWESWWLNAGQDTLKLHWTMKENIFIPNHETVLDDVLREEGLTADHPRFQREYLGMFMYDTEAKVYNLTDANYFDIEEFNEWVKPPAGWHIIRPKTPFGVQDPEADLPWNDIRFTGGLDYGFSDSDAFVITAFSISKPERYILYQWKQNHSGVGDVAAAVRRGIEEVASKCELFKDAVARDDFKIYCDYAGAGSKITFDLRTSYNLPVVNAIKQDKDGAIDMLQEDVRKGRLRIQKDSPFDEECKSIVWERDENDVIRRVVDDNAFHPDVADAVLYSLRPCWQCFNEGKGDAE